MNHETNSNPATLVPIDAASEPVDLHRVAFSIVNAFMLGAPGSPDRTWAMIDTGLATSHGKIIREAAARYGPKSRPAAIILTHGHFDHVGSLKALAEEWDCPIFAHELEMPYLTGRSSYPPPDPSVGGGMMARLSPTYPRGPIDIGRRLRPLPGDHTVPDAPGWRWIHTPGYCPGHVALFRDSDRALIAGDAFVTTRQESAIYAISHKPVVSRPPAYYTIDWVQAEQSVKTLAALEPEIAATGHGPMLQGAVMRQHLHQLADTFHQEAIPRKGRYVRRPAKADATGVTFVPPKY